jgi:hypothetical protein
LTSFTVMAILATFTIFAVRWTIFSLLTIFTLHNLTNFTSGDWRICSCVCVLVDSNLISLIGRKSTQPPGHSI